MSRWRSWSLGLVMALILVGCKQQPMILTVVVTSPPRVVTPIPTIGDIVESFPIVICLPAEPKTFNPYTASSSEREILASMSQGWENAGYSDDIFEGGEFPSFSNGDMVTSGQNIELTLRFSYKMYWSDGSPFTVDDLLLTYDYRISQHQIQGGPVNIDKINDYTLYVVYQGGSKSEHDILNEVLSNFTPPLPSHLRREGTSTREFLNSYYSDLPAATLGPFGERNQGNGLEAIISASGLSKTGDRRSQLLRLSSASSLTKMSGWRQPYLVSVTTASFINRQSHLSSWFSKYQIEAW